MSATPAVPPNPSSSGSSPDSRAAFRTKIVSTRITPEELREIEAAAKRDGKKFAEWLRDVVLKSARQGPADPAELLLSEVAATRYMLLNLFHATAQANGEGKHLLPESVLKIRDTADARKLGTARKMLEEFLAAESKTGSKTGAER